MNKPNNDKPDASFNLLTIGWRKHWNLAICCLLLSISCICVAQDVYQADPVKKQTKAQKSGDLYVDPQFDFVTFQSVTLDIYVTDESGEPAEGIVVRLLSIEPDITESADPRIADASLLSISRTDQFGRVFQEVEISNSVEKVLLEMNANAQTNKAIFTLEDSHSLSFTFVSE